MGKSRITISTLCMSTLMLSYMAVVPLLAEIYKSFPTATVTQIQMVYTIPSIITIPTMLLSGKLVYYFSKKGLVLTSMILVVVFGILPVFFNNSLLFLYFVSGGMGIGLGIITTISSNIISDHFDGLECSKIMGYQSAAISIGAMIISVLSGKIAAIDWSYSYLVYLIFIPCIWIVSKFLPKDTPVRKVIKSKRELDGRLLYFAFLTFLCGVFVTGYNTNIALFIRNKNFGGAEVSGIVNSLCMLVGIPAGFFVGKLSKIFKRNIFFVSVACISCGFFITAASSNIIYVYLGSLLIGFGFSVRNPSVLTYAVQLASPDNSTSAIAVVSAALSAGNFVSPFIINVLMKVIGNSVSEVFLACAVCSLIISGLYLFTTPSKNTYEIGKY